MTNPYLELVARLETQGGKKSIKGPNGEDSNNPYNIKLSAAEREAGVLGYRAVDKAEKSNDHYKVFASREEADKAFMGLMERRYPEALAAMQEPWGPESITKFATGLKKRGYATDPDYVAKLVNVGASIKGDGYVPPAKQVDRRQQEMNAVINSYILRPADDKALRLANARREADNFVQQAEAASRPTLGERFSAAYSDNTDLQIFKGVKEILFGPKYPKQEGYTPDSTLLPSGADSNLVNDFKLAGSQAETDAILEDYREEQERMKTVMSGGIASGIALSFAAEVPALSNLLPGVAAAKLMAVPVKVGVNVVKVSRFAHLMSEGRTSAAVGTAIAENVVSGTVVEAVRQGVTGDYSLADMGIAAAADVAFGLGTSALAAKGAGQALHAAAVRGEVDRYTGLVERAKSELGDSTSPEDLRTRADELYKADLENVVKQADTHEVPVERKLLNVVEDTPEQAPEAKLPSTVPQVAEGAPATRVPVEDPTPVALSEPVETTGYLPLPKELAGAKPTYAYGTSKYTLSFESDIDKALYVIAGNKPSKRDADYMAYLRSMANVELTDDQLRAYGKQVRDRIKQQAAAGKGGELTISDSAKADQLSAVDGTPSIAEAFRTTAKFEVNSIDGWANHFKPGGRFEGKITEYTEGKYTKLTDIEKLPAGIHASGALTPETKVAIATMQALHKRFMPDTTLTVHFGKAADGKGGFANGKAAQINSKLAMIVVDPSLAPSQVIQAGIHEMGHVLFNREIGKLGTADLDGLRKSYLAFRAEAASGTPDGNTARAMRYSAGNVAQYPSKEFTTKLTSGYELEFDEFAAEQWAKYVDKDVLGENRFGLTAKAVSVLKQALELVMRLLKAAKRERIDVDVKFEEFFDSVFARNEPSADQLSASSKAVNSVAAIQTDPDTARLGLSTLPVETDTDRANVKQMLELHKRAEAWEVKNPMDAEYNKRVQNLADNNVFNVASTGLIMLKSESPLVRMIASELLEDASGVQKGRKDTAAIAKHITERAIMKNAINDFQTAYAFWKKDKQGAGLWEDMVGGKHWEEFNKLVASEIEARRVAKGPVSTDANVKAAADSLEAGYTRAATQQRKAKTLGWASLPESSVGYMPHKMSPQKVVNMTNEQQQILHTALTDQFITVEGWDASFSDMLASKYMKRVRDRAYGKYDSVIGGNSQGAADIVQDALIAMNLSPSEVRAHMVNYTKGAANFTKGRVELDLNKVYTTSTGTFRLMDVFETNQIELLRSQAGRVSGEVALAKYGVYGKPGLQLLKEAMQYGADGKKALDREFDAFDQIAAEFMNEPFGNHTGKFLERAMAANTLVRLGGIAFNQLAETINGVFHVGAARALESVTSIGRLRSEIKDLAAGKAVDNPIIGSIELVGGAEFGTDAYKFVMPFDSPDHAYPTYGQDTLTLTDRLLRGGNHLQAKLSGWRMIHSAQQRGMSEQIVHKMMRYVREGKDDVALRDFGITEEVQKYLSDNLDKVATFDGNRLVRFEADKLPEGPLREQVIQAVWRGTQQIIQGTYIGERGKWAHDGFLKVLTQFRSFSLTSMEKQWGRQRNQRGTYAAFGMAMGAMSLAAPIYAARVYASSIGREDQAEYLEERLTAQNIARATLNYIALSGMAGDFIDLTTALAPDAVKEATGFNPLGSTGKEADLVGNYVLPSASLVNDGFKWLQSPTEVGDLARILPMSRLPFLVPLMNVAKEE